MSIFQKKTRNHKKLWHFFDVFYPYFFAQPWEKLGFFFAIFFFELFLYYQVKEESPASAPFGQPPLGLSVRTVRPMGHAFAAPRSADWCGAARLFRNNPLRVAPLSQKWRFCVSLKIHFKNFAKSNFCKVLLISSKQSCFPARPAPPGQPLRGGRHCSPKNDTVLPEQLPTPTDNDRQRRAP